MLAAVQNPDTITSVEAFWEIADTTKALEKYRIDKNLQYLQIAPLSVLKNILIQYRFFTHFYITDMALLIAKLPFGELRTILAEILYEELGLGNPNEAHPELYDNFLFSIGVTKNELEQANSLCLQNLQNIQHSLQHHNWPYAVGLRGMGGECLCQIYLTTMYEYLSKNPEIIKLSDRIAWKFWDIHIGEVDLHHQEIMRNAINRLISTNPSLISELTQGYLESKTAWDSFWTHIYHAARKNENEYPSFA